MRDLGLDYVADYNYKNKSLNIIQEMERLLNRSCVMFEWHNLPDTIPQEQLELMLQSQGYAIIGYADDNRLYAFYGSLGGMEDEYYRPTEAIVSVPYLQFNKIFKIGSDCVVIKNDLNTQGLLPLYSKYATFLSETDISIMMELVNLRVQTHIVASDNRAIESAEKYLEGLENGNMGVIADTQMFENVKIYDKQRVSNIDKLKDLRQYITGSMYNEIGLATNYNLKKERITQAEVELNTDSLYPMIDNMYERRKEGIRAVNDMFGVSWDIEYNSSWDYRIYNGEQITTKGDDNDITDNEVTDNDTDKGP